MDRYEYQRDGLPSEPMRYNYSKYGGDAFLDSYFESRECAVALLSAYIDRGIEGGLKGMEPEERLEFNVLSHIVVPDFYDRLDEGDGAGSVDAGEWTGKVAERAERLPALYNYYMSGLIGGSLGLGGALLTVSVFKDGGFLTEETLKMILLDRTRLLPFEVVEAEEIIDRLTKKYEVFQRVFSGYDSSFKKSSDEFTNPVNYALLGVISADIFVKEENYRDLNTLLKINDLLASVSPERAGLTGAMLIKASLEKEVDLIRGLRER